MAQPPAKMMKLDSGISSSGGYFSLDKNVFCSARFLLSIFSIEHINPKNILEMLAAEYAGSNLAARTSVINPTERHMVKMFVTEMRKLEQYFVSLCEDVLLDVLRFGSRRRIAILERIGRRFHRIAKNFFYKTPFIQLNVELKCTGRLLFYYIPYQWRSDQEQRAEWAWGAESGTSLLYPPPPIWTFF